jgi:hypothetical protein
MKNLKALADEFHVARRASVATGDPLLRVAAGSRTGSGRTRSTPAQLMPYLSLYIIAAGPVSSGS